MIEPHCRCPGCGVCDSVHMLDTIRRDAKRKLADIEADARFHAAPANVAVNAPLALIQLEMKTQHRIYKDLIGLIGKVLEDD